MRACFPFGKQNDQGPKNYAAKCGRKSPEEERNAPEAGEKGKIFSACSIKYVSLYATKSGNG
jgi:hypothetical protein